MMPNDSRVLKFLYPNYQQDAIKHIHLYQLPSVILNEEKCIKRLRQSKVKCYNCGAYDTDELPVITVCESRCTSLCLNCYAQIMWQSRFDTNKSLCPNCNL